MFGYLLIFFSRVCDVTLSTMRTLMVVQGRRGLAALIGFFEVTIYVLILNTVMKNMDNPFNVIAYGLGFAAGNYVGITIEDKIALGNISVQIIVNTSLTEELTTEIRSRGFGVTVMDGHGQYSDTSVLLVVIGRKDYLPLRNLTTKIAPNAFITVNSLKQLSGGFFKKK